LGQSAFGREPSNDVEVFRAHVQVPNPSLDPQVILLRRNVKAYFESSELCLAIILNIGVNDEFITLSLRGRYLNGHGVVSNDPTVELGVQIDPCTFL
jgi:hypothetical protein